MIDPKFTEKIAQWLQGDHGAAESIEAGAMLLLQLNRDRAMYQRIMRRPQRELPFLEYKLRRFLQLRQDGRTIKDVVAIDREVTPQIQAAVASPESGDGDTLPVPAGDDGGTGFVVRKGVRPDHDKLPEEIKSLWAKNAERWKKIKSAFESCKTLTEPCDRYEYLKVLKETWYKYKEDMARYDDYRLGDAVTVGGKAEEPALTPEQEKELKNADSYVSKNLPQLQQLVNDAKAEDFDEKQQAALENLRDRVQQRVDVLLQYGRTLSDERREQLVQCDIRVTLPTSEKDESGKESE